MIWIEQLNWYIHRKIVIGFSFMVPDVKFNEAYISFIFTHPEWRRAGIAKFMLYHLIQVQYLTFNIPNTFIVFLGQSHKHLTSKDAFNINVNPQIYITVKNCSSFLYFQDSVLIKSEAINVTLFLKTFVKLLTKTWIFTVVYCLRNTPYLITFFIWKSYSPCSIHLLM